MTEIKRLPGVALRSVARTAMAVLRDTEAIAALEFGIVAPLMIYTLFAAADIANGLEISRRLTVAANTLAELTSQVSTSSSCTVNGTATTCNTPSGSVSDAQFSLIFNSIVTTFPDVLADANSKQINWQADIQPIVTEVEFGPSTTCVVNVDTTSAYLPPPSSSAGSGCTTATAVWSVGFKNAGFPATNRACSVLNPSGSNTGNPNLTSLPPGIYAPGTAIVVDIFYHYKPTYTKWLTGTLTFHRTAYLPPRFFYILSYDTTASGSPYTSCGGTILSS